MKALKHLKTISKFGAGTFVDTIIIELAAAEKHRFTNPKKHLKKLKETADKLSDHLDNKQHLCTGLAFKTLTEDSLVS